MNISFKQKYYDSRTWYEKVWVIQIFHLVRITESREWTLSMTANEFEISTGLASENLKLADAIQKDFSLINCRTRQEALDKIK